MTSWRIDANSAESLSARRDPVKESENNSPRQRGKLVAMPGHWKNRRQKQAFAGPAHVGPKATSFGDTEKARGRPAMASAGTATKCQEPRETRAENPPHPAACLPG